MIDKITLEITPATRIDDAISDAMDMAIQYKTTVLFKFNSCHMIVDLSKDAEELEEEYQEYMNSRG